MGTYVVGVPRSVSAGARGHSYGSPRGKERQWPKDSSHTTVTWRLPGARTALR